MTRTETDKLMEQQQEVFDTVINFKGEIIEIRKIQKKINYRLESAMILFAVTSILILFTYFT